LEPLQLAVGDLKIIQNTLISTLSAHRRTVPFVAKAIGHPIVKYASLLMSGKLLSEINFTEEPTFSHVCVKEVVVPWRKFAGGWV